MNEATWARQTAGGAGRRAAIAHEDTGKETFFVDRSKVPWMVGAPREVPLTRFTASDGSVFAVGTIVGAYDNPMRSSTWPDKHALSRAYADFSTLIETMASTPGTRPFDVLTADKLPDVVINLPRVFSDSTLVGHGVLVTTGGKNEKPKEKVYLFFGACAKRDLPGFQRHLRTAGYPQGRK